MDKNHCIKIKIMEPKKNFDIKIQDTNKMTYQIPLQGSLGLLALGDVGLMTWRKAKFEAYQTAKNRKLEEK